MKPRYRHALLGLLCLGLVPFGAACQLGDLLDEDAAKASADEDDETSPKKKKKRRRSKKSKTKDEEPKAEVGADGLLRLPDGSIPAPEPGQWRIPPMGSWTKMEPTKESKGGMTTTSSWLRKRNGNEYLVQVEVTGKMPVIAKAWVRVGDYKAADEDNLTLLTLEGKVGPLGHRKYPVGSNPMFEQIFDRFIAATTPTKLEGLPQEDVKTPVGLFRQCYVKTETVTAFGITATTTSYIHPALGGSGAVKSTSKDGQITVLTALDDEGAVEKLK